MAGRITPDDLYRFRFVDHARISPDGRRVAYQLWWPDGEERANRGHIVLQDLGSSSQPLELTSGPYDSAPEWSPAGDRILCLRKSEGPPQLYVVDAVVGAEPVLLAELPDGVVAARWSPDGTRVAFVGRVPSEPEGVVDDPRPPEGRPGRRPPVVRVVTRLNQRADGRGHLDGRHDHLFVMPVAGGEPKQLTTGPWDVQDLTWSPDGARLAILCNPQADADRRREVELHLVDLEGGRTPLVTEKLITGVAWSPRGDVLAFTAPLEQGAGMLARLWLVPVEGGRDPVCMTADLDLSEGDGVITDTRPGHEVPLTWSSGGSRVYFLASGPGWTGIHSVDLEGQVRAEVTGLRRIYDFDVVRGTAVYCSADPTHPGELNVHDGREERRLTQLNPWLADRLLALPERVQAEAADGTPLEGWILKPVGFDPESKYPLVLAVHGGPHGQYGWAFFHEFQVLAGMGIAVFYMNPRGSDGYGESFRTAVVRDWGGNDFQDLMTGLDHVIGLGFADPARLGIAGGSYGGFMTNWAISQTDRFRAAVAMRSLSNLVSDYAINDIVPWGALEMGPEPWPNPEELWSRSPIRYVKNIKTPLLLTHGEMDIRCPIEQAEEMFGALRLLGREVELLRFPEETHELSRSGRPDRRVERLERIAAWFRTHLLEAVPELETEEPGS